MISDLPKAEIEHGHTLRFVRHVDQPPERVWRAIQPQPVPDYAIP
jgi:hypothetical protein